MLPHGDRPPLDGWWAASWSRPALLVGCKLSRPGGCQADPPRPRRVPHVDCPALDARQHPGESQEPRRLPHVDRPPCRLPITDKLPRPVGGVQAVEAWRVPGRPAQAAAGASCRLPRPGCHAASWREPGTAAVASWRSPALSVANY